MDLNIARRFRQTGYLFLFLIATGQYLFGQPGSLALSSGSTVQGGTISLNLTYTSSGNQPAGLVWTFAYSPSDIVHISVAPGSAATAAGKTLSCADPSGSYTCLVTGINSNTIPNGIIGVLTVTLSPAVTATSVGITNALGATFDGQAYITSGTGGTITAIPATPVVSALSCNPTSLLGAASSNCTITLSAAAPAGGAAISLSSNNSNLTAPSRVTVPAGSTTATFTATSGGVSADQNVTLTATYNGTSQAAALSLVASTVVTSLQCNPTTLGSNASSNCTVTLSKPAGSGGAVVSLSSTSLPGLMVPPSVTVPANSTTGSFTVSTSTIGADQNGSLTASYNGASQSVNISLAAATVISSLQCSPTTLGSNASSNCTVTLSKAAPGAGAVVGLSSTGLPGLTVPASVTVPASAATGSFTISTGTVSANQNGSLTASYNGKSQSTNINLTAPTVTVISSLQCNPTTLARAASSNCSVTLSASAAPGAAVVTLSTTLSNVTVPPVAIVPPGSTTGAFTVSTSLWLFSDQTGSVTATYNGSSQAVSFTLTTSAPITSVELSCGASNLTSGDSTTCTVHLPKGAAPGGVRVSLSSDNPRLPVPDAVLVAEGSQLATFQVGSVVSDHDEKATIQASLTDSSQTTSILLRGHEPASLTCAPKVVSAGHRGACELRLNSVPEADVVEIELSSNSENLKVPQVITTRPGQSRVHFEVLAQPEASQQIARIAARFGANEVQENLTLSSEAAPVLRLPKKFLAKFDDVVRFTASASDASGLPVSLSASSLPAGASFDSLTGEFQWTPSDAQAGRHEIAFTATNSINLSTTEHVRIEVGSGQPVIDTLANAASGSQESVCSPGSVASVHGRWLASRRASDPAGNSIELAGVRVKLNGTMAPVLSAEPTRIDFLCPQLASGTPIEAAVETDAGTSDVVKTVMQPTTPGIFSLDGSGRGQGRVFLQDSSRVAIVRDFRTAGQPAQPGDYLLIRATGVGSGEDLPALKPLVNIGAVPVQAESANPVHGSAGVYEVKVKLPIGVPTGNDVPVSFELPGPDAAKSNTVSVAIEPVQQ